VVASDARGLAAPVHVQVAAREDFVPLLRSVTTAVAGPASLSFDVMADLRLLVDEASAQVLSADDVRTSLTLELRTLPGCIEALVWSDGRPQTWPPDDFTASLGWRVLSALADEVAFERRDDGPAIRLHKRTDASGIHKRTDASDIRELTDASDICERTDASDIRGRTQAAAGGR
jgi:anti-sigma regulatory factor (Ser/Thr protein kinase)